ncbi:MAG: 16S rRNA (cytosine(1402)-N(4))-methyltransferase RsmH [Rhodospirillaceae bacterium]|nr:16S rRNA (cytosine(1402)-N(4))-methyltransferase RsmH [Rhodospirillaceae bacterium]
MIDGHTPVLLRETMSALAVKDGGHYVDATFGRGGYTQAILTAADCVVTAIDQDPAAIAFGKSLQLRFKGRLTLIEGRFGGMDRLIRRITDASVDGVALDIGVSSPQLDSPERGFSFHRDGPLDMRMGATGQTAADVVNTASESALSSIIFQLGQDRAARRIAKAIVASRAQGAITRTVQLADIIRSAQPEAHTSRIDPATRTFQALRIHVNHELEELDDGLRSAERLLQPGGRLAVVCFHSLEDRRVKRFIRTRSEGAPRMSRHWPVAGDRRAPTFRLLHRRAIRPSLAEIETNPRARSARLRAAERTAASVWTHDLSDEAAGGAT